MSRAQAARLALLCCVFMAAVAASLGMPFNVEAVARRFGGTNAGYGMLAAAELLCIAVGTLAGSRLAGWRGPRVIAGTGLVLALAANGASVLAPSLAMLMVVRAAAGFGAGGVIAAIMYVAGRSEAPNLVFGALNSTVGLLGLLLSFGLPRLVESHGTAGPYGLYALLALVALACIAAFHDRTAAAAPGPASRSLGKGQWPPLLGLGVVFLGHSALVIFIVRIGAGTGIPITTLGFIFMGISLVSVVLPVLSGIYGVRLPAVLVMAVTLVLLAVAANALAGARSLAMFAAAAAVYAAMPTAMMPVVLTAFARHDPSGRLTAANSAFITVGAAVAPVIGGRLIDQGGYAMVAWMSTGCFILGGLLLTGTLLAADRERRAAA